MIGMLRYGTSFVVRSIHVLITNPILLVYSTLPVLMVHTMSTLGMPLFKAIAYGTAGSATEFLVYKVLPVATIGIKVFFVAALAHHAMHILQGEFTGIKESIAGATKRLPALIWWALMVILYQMLSAYLGITIHSLVSGALFRQNALYIMLALIYAGITGIVIALTSLVIPIIATEKTGMLTACKRSAHLIIQYAGVFLGLLLLLFATDIIELILMRNLFDYRMAVTLFFGIFIRPITILAYTLFYYHYYAQPKPELADYFPRDL